MWEILSAALLPLLSLGLGDSVYFLYAGVRYRDRRQSVVAAIYVALLVLAIVCFAVDPSPDNADYLTSAEWMGIALVIFPPLVSAVHGPLVAYHLGRERRTWALRELARQVAAHEPAHARQIGIGRPMQLRNYSDGGLVDINHASAAELAALTGVGPILAHHIIYDRDQRGPFRSVDDLVQRGLLPARLLHRIADRLVCIGAG
jgi:SARP family transcriptional regulator, regulator of embCAB operon